MAIANRNALSWVNEAVTDSTKKNRTALLRAWVLGNGWAQTPENGSYTSIFQAADVATEQIRKGELDLYDTAKAMLKWYVEKNPNGENTARYYRSCLPGYFTYRLGKDAVDETEWAHLPYKDFVFFGKSHLTRENLRTMLTVAPTPRAKALISILTTGCRIQEARFLKVKDLDLAKKPAWVTFGAKNTKSRYSRTAFLSDEATQFVKSYLETRTIKSEYLFPGYKSEVVEGKLVNTEIGERPAAKESAWETVNRVFRLAGLGERNERGQFVFHPHSVRNAVMDWMRIAGLNEKYVLDIVGHSGLEKHYPTDPNEMAPVWYEKCNSAFCFLRVVDGQTTERVQTLQQRVDQLEKGIEIDKQIIEEQFLKPGMNAPNLGVSTARPKFETRRISLDSEEEYIQAIADGFVEAGRINHSVIMKRAVA
jgi:integrase